MSGRLRVFLDGAGTGSRNMERDAHFLEAHQRGDEPILRIYWWAPPCVTIGYNQDTEAFDAPAANAAGYDLVRRPTGGRAILHAQELTYAVIGTSPGKIFGHSLHDAYMTINKALLHFLAGLNVAADISAGESREAQRGLVCFHSAGRHEIGVGGRKIIGSAQRRARGVFLQHGSILTGPLHRELVRFLGLDGAAEDKARLDLESGTTDLGALLGREIEAGDLENLSSQLMRSFAEVLSLEPVIMPR